MCNPAGITDSSRRVGEGGRKYATTSVSATYRAFARRCTHPICSRMRISTTRMTPRMIGSAAEVGVSSAPHFEDILASSAQAIPTSTCYALCVCTYW